MKERTCPRESGMRGLRQNNSNMCRHEGSERWVAQNCGRIAAVQLVAAPAGKHVADLPGLGARHRRDGTNDTFSSRKVMQFGPKMVGQLAQTYAIVGRKELVMVHEPGLQVGFPVAVATGNYQNWFDMLNRNSWVSSKSSLTTGSA
jgi:hypothetical protein